jgi:hypothetical protein
LFLDISNTVKFHIYLGEEGCIPHGPNGIPLQRFGNFSMVLEKPKEQLIRSMYHWLARDFEVNLDVTLLTVHIVVK